LTLNHTLNYILAKRKEFLLPFSAQVTTASTYLKGGGGEAADGWPVPRAGKIVGLQVWDGLALNEAAGEVSIAAGDRLSLYALYGGTTFTVYARINGVNTTLGAATVAPNATLVATLNLILE